MFSRRDVIVAVAPYLYGRAPAELARAVSAVLRDPEAVALVGAPRASERAYATASVLATETAIERAVERGISAVTAAKVGADVAEGAVARQESGLGAALTAGQRAAVVAITTSGRQVELVCGLAGSGKTTVMAAVRDAFSAQGFSVVGTSSSGQAARTLGREAGISASPTLASLRWQLGHGRLAFSEHHVVVLDEAGMTDDRDVSFLVGQALLAGAKVVMVGDDRQLGAVGPGGALGALVSRHGGAVHELCENVRTKDEAERQALAELRSGDVGRAVGFYAASGRVVSAPSRGEALAKMVEGWSSDLAAGKDAAMFAWRRANVAELNRLAREQMAAAGALSGPELTAPGGAAYRAGDRVVALAPGRGGQVVTSERGVVVSVDPEACCLVARMGDGREQVFEADETGAGRLAHGYATTVHRSQGATCGRGHVYEDGGGRELAYVAMSRAKEETHVYVAADDADQAADDLARSWAEERRWRWAIDTATPASLRREALMAERAMLAAAVPPTLPQICARPARNVRLLPGSWRCCGPQAAGPLPVSWAVPLKSCSTPATAVPCPSSTPGTSSGRGGHAGTPGTGHGTPRRKSRRRPAGWPSCSARRSAGSQKPWAGPANASTLWPRRPACRARWLAAHPGALGRLAAIDVEISGIDEQVDLDRSAVVRDLCPELKRSRPGNHLGAGRSPSYDLGINRDDFGFGL